MESTQQNPGTEVKTTSKNRYKSLDEQIVAMQLAFDNVMIPEIFAKMQTVGYTQERINGMKTNLATLETKKLIQVKESAEQSSVQKVFDDKKEEVHGLYMNHVKLLRVYFAGNVHARALLNLDDATPKAYSSWSDTLKNFYHQLAGEPRIQTQAATVGVTQDVVNAQIAALEAVNTLRESVKKESAEATAATDARDAAFDVVYPQYTELIKYAKIVLDENQLKALGV